ncbi:MAG: hypothetical protein QM723_40655 [Myxococcaceae bacterium]
MTRAIRDAGNTSAPEVKRRRRLARDALLCAIAFNHSGVQTIGMQEELRRMLPYFAPPTAGVYPVRVKPGESFESEFTNVFTWFIHPNLLPKWRLHLFEEPVGANGRTIRGNRVDERLVDLASESGCRVVSNEGEEGRVRRRARERNVTVLAPQEVFGSVDVSEVCRHFLGSFAQSRTRFLDERAERFGSGDKMGDVLDMVRDFYWQVFQS